MIHTDRALAFVLNVIAVDLLLCSPAVVWAVWGRLI